MIDSQDIINAAREELDAGSGGPEGGGPGDKADGGLFLVDVKVHCDEVEVFIDSDAVGEDGRIRGVSVEDCIALTRAIETRFDRDADDFSLTVSSAGIGQPLRVPRQYRKLIGKNVEVVTAGGTKFVAVLEGMEEAGVTLSYPEKQKIEGKKRPEIVTVTKIFPLAEIKTTKEHIDFK